MQTIHQDTNPKTAVRSSWITTWMRAGALAMALISAVLAAGSARAAVSITRDEVVVRSSGAGAIVTRSPFRLRIVSGLGTSVLSEVPNRQPAARTVAVTADPLAPGIEPKHSGQLYAPLSFLVGSQTIAQYDGGTWAGNLLSGSRSGVQYAARRVISGRRRGSGVDLTISTNDPSGRKLEMQIQPQGNDLMRVSVSAHPSTGVALMSDSFTSSTDEAFYGFGGVHDSLDQHGRALASFVEEENIPHIGTSGPSSILYPNGPTATFYPQPQFISSHGYGFLLDQPQLSWFRLDSDRPDAWSVAARASTLTYLATTGTPRQAVATLTALTGRQPAPPQWALGPMLDRLVRNGTETESNYESLLHQDIANIDRYHLPLTGYRIEGWGFRNADNDGIILYNPRLETFALQSKIVAELKVRHIHPLAYLRPFITPGSAADRAGLTVRGADGGTFTTTGTLHQHIALLDFSNPAAVRWWKVEVAKVLNLGFDGFMADFGEEVLDGARFANGQTGVAMHNGYTILYAKATREAIEAYARTHPHRRLWFYNRSGYSGTPGSTAYEGGNVPGDEATDWSQASGLASLSEDMLGRAVGGAYGYSTDIGGYYDYTTPPTTKELFLRWSEWAALSPIFRLHGAGRTGTHTPWSFDPQTVRVYNALSLLHEKAAPLILRLWREADRTGLPPTRPLWLEFPDDRQAAAQQQEWTLGDNVLVAPVVTQGATSRRVYFPRGCWRDPETRLLEHGPAYHRVAAPLTRLPYFLRCATQPFRNH
jgi:alpha-glucosidase